jgi:apolipoprotein N-acyltransferase
MRRFVRAGALYLPALLTGVLLFLSAPGLVGFGPLAWVALVPLLMACRSVSPFRGFKLGLAAGLLYYLLLLYWIIIVLSTYGQLSWWIAMLALVLLALYMGLYLGLFTAGFAWLSVRIPVLWTAPVLWVALDFVRSRLFSGFPWQDLAYSQYRIPLLIQSADLFGHEGITFLIVLANVLLVAIAARLRRQPRPEHPASVIAAAVLLLASVIYGGIRYGEIQDAIEKAPSWPVTVVQGDIPQDRKWTPAFRWETVARYIRLSKQSLTHRDSTLLIWPETALPFYPQENPLFRELLAELVHPADVCLLTGAPRRKLEDGTLHYYNSAFLISGAGRIVGVYDKQHLVPFGEYIPFRHLLPFAAPIVETMGDFTPGTTIGPLSCGGVKIGVLICFESIFPELARRQTANGAQLLVNITNDAWFGRSSAPWQHLSMAVLRAVENRRPLARAANTGISGFIDPLGRLTKASSLFEPAYLTARVPLLTEKSFYVRHGHHLPLTCFLLLAPMFLLAARRKLHT